MIRVRNLSKVFQIPHVKKETLYHNIISLVLKNYEYETFYALKDITFSVLPNQFVGVIGRNGSGKSTLLKILSRIYKPTEGEVIVNDEIFPLLELNVGFQRNFSVRDNIFIYGALLGFTRKEMNKKLDAILEFSELERFADAKLDTLSTGMQSRLGFAIAIQSPAPILLVDEVLAVGDSVFREKCNKVFKKYKVEGRTVVLVTHDLSAVREFCDRVLLLNDGHLVGDGNPDEIITLYKEKILPISEKTDDGVSTNVVPSKGFPI